MENQKPASIGIPIRLQKVKYGDGIRLLKTSLIFSFGCRHLISATQFDGAETF